MVRVERKGVGGGKGEWMGKGRREEWDGEWDGDLTFKINNKKCFKFSP